MKLIRIGTILCGMFFGLLFKVAGQTADTNQTMISGNDSLVHVAYGTVEKKDLTGAISVVNPSDYLEKDYGTYPLEGVNAFIGGSNLWGLGTPLVLIDGVPGNITDVTTTAISQITFLKGANAVVLYGSRAANGVILITTKQGKVGKIKKNIRVNGGVNVPIEYPTYLGSADYMTYYNQACTNDGLSPLYDAATISKYASHSNIYQYPDVNYYSSDYLRKMYTSYSANAEFSGGTERARFYALVDYQGQNSLLKFGEGNNENTSRLSIRGNIELKLNDFINAFVHTSTVFNDSRSSMGNYWSNAATLRPNYFSPFVPISLISNSATNGQTYIKNAHNIIDGLYLLGGTQQYMTNPISDVYAGGYKTNTSRLFQYVTGVNADLSQALKGLSFHGQISIDYLDTYTDSLSTKYAVYSPTWTGDSITGLTKYNTDNNSRVQSIGNVFEDQTIDFNVHMDYVNSFNLNNVSAMLVGSGTLQRQTGDFQYQTNSNLGLQLAYNYDHRYYADFSGAVVNSTLLPSNARVAFSPTFSLGWLLTGENFLKHSKVVDRLKLSASAGIVNTDLDLSNNFYLYDPVYYSSYGYSWHDGSYSNSATTALHGDNQHLSYAKRKEVNLDIDGSFFNNQLGVQATAFLIDKTGIPEQRFTQYPSYFNTYYPTSSFVPYTNYGEDQYKGFDVQVNFRQKIGDVNLMVGAAGTYATSKVLKVDEIYANSYQNRAGKPIDAIFGLVSQGFFADQNDITNHAVQEFGTVAPGDIKYKDENGDGVIDQRDQVMIGRWGSPFTCGVNLTLQWKNFTFFALGTGQYGGTGIKSGSYYWVYGSEKYSNVVLNSWTDATKNTATYPRLTTLSSNNNFQYSTFWAYSTDRFDLSKVQFTYTLPKKLLINSPLKNINIYVNGNNLLTFAKNRKIMELNVGTTPQTRLYNVGIKAEF
ncbi:SusC/RagA family TonB-linked outer membrane protein [Microbacter margulisiae]|uniref:TonB-linked SusC/RagA family outer membrane protein n=1 Tax=Microbacter margulisiae TaxID=1350067 RepID=A0A7W5DS91_9PORP|nr:SusC/RagA family TonB-linked outer membrane protein [Microbacter margulisiae]MBB3188125.1 TonB-linked SusC/RagA family outer membrane protein [Microbacter margulisiae]